MVNSLGFVKPCLLEGSTQQSRPRKNNRKAVAQRFDLDE
jgi:hypothetical protein